MLQPVKYISSLFAVLVALAPKQLCAQKISVKIPYNVDKNYHYYFAGDHIIGIPGGVGFRGVQQYCLWNARTGRFIHGFERTRINYHSVIFSQDFRYFLLNPSSDVLYIGDVAGDYIIDSIPFHPTIQLRSDVKIAPNNKFLIYQRNNFSDTLFIYNIETKTSTLVLGRYDVPNSIISADGKKIFLWQWSGEVKIINPQGETISVIKATTKINRQNIYLQFGYSVEDQLYQVLDDQTLWLFKTTDSSSQKILDVETAFPVKNGQLLYVRKGAQGWQCVLRDIRTTKETALMRVTEKCKISASGNNFLITDINENFEKIYTAIEQQSGKKVLTVGPTYNKEHIIRFELSSDGRFALLMGYQNIYKINLLTNKVLCKIPSTTQSFDSKDITLSPDNKRYLFKNEENVHCYENNNQSPRFALQTAGPNNRYEITGFSNDGRHIEINNYQYGELKWSLDSGKLSISKPRATEDYNADKSRLLQSEMMSVLNLYNGKTHKLIKQLQLDVSGFNRVYFEDIHAFGIYDFLPMKFYLFDMATGNLRWSKEIQMSQGIIFDKKNKIFITRNENNYVVYELATGKLLGDIHRGRLLGEPIINETSTAVYIVDVLGKVSQYSIPELKRSSVQTGMPPELNKTHFTSFADDGQSVKIGSYGSNSFTDTLYFTNHSKRYLRGEHLVKESPAHDILLAYNGVDYVEIYDLVRKAHVGALSVGHIQVKGLFVSPDSRMAGILGLQKELHLYNIPERRFIGTFYYFADSLRQPAFIAADGFYFIDKRDAAEVSFMANNQSYDFDQWDLQYNRPDKVLAMIGSTRQSLVSQYRDAYYKRIRNMEIDTSQFSDNFNVPQLTITNLDSLEQASSSTGSAELLLHVHDEYPGNTIKRIFITINGNPIYGMRGKELADHPTRDTTFSVAIPLAPGMNTIKVSCLNNRAAESTRQLLTVQYQPVKQESTQTYFVGIGVTNYKTLRSELSYPVKNIQSLDSLFTRAGRQNGTKRHLLLDSLATRDRIVALKASLLEHVKPGDKLILALSGHGMIAKQQGNSEFYFATWDIDPKDPANRGLSYRDIEWLLDSIPAQNKVVLLDACRSGAQDRDTTINNRESFVFMQETFINLSRHNGSSVIAASAGDRDSYEPPKLSYSVFTHFVLEAFRKNLADEDRNGRISVNELQLFVNTRVAQYTNQLQKANSRSYNYDNNWVFDITNQ